MAIQEKLDSKVVDWIEKVSDEVLKSQRVAHLFERGF
jgi:hypothetical protein